MIDGKHITHARQAKIAAAKLGGSSTVDARGSGAGMTGKKEGKGKKITKGEGKGKKGKRGKGDESDTSSLSDLSE